MVQETKVNLCYMYPILFGKIPPTARTYVPPEKKKKRVDLSSSNMIWVPMLLLGVILALGVQSFAPAGVKFLSRTGSSKMLSAVESTTLKANGNGRSYQVLAAPDMTNMAQQIYQIDPNMVASESDDNDNTCASSLQSKQSSIPCLLDRIDSLDRLRDSNLDMDCASLDDGTFKRFRAMSEDQGFGKVTCSKSKTRIVNNVNENDDNRRPVKGEIFEGTMTEGVEGTGRCLDKKVIIVDDSVPTGIGDTFFESQTLKRAEAGVSSKEKEVSAFVAHGLFLSNENEERCFQRQRQRQGQRKTETETEDIDCFEKFYLADSINSIADGL